MATERKISEGVKIRTQIDTESVRSVMLVNGGGSIALLALLPAIMGTPLVIGMLFALAFWVAGLALAVIHNVLRRKCSNIYDNFNYRPPPGKPRYILVGGVPRTLAVPNVPWVCWWSWRCLYAAIAAFVIGGAVMVIAGFWNLDVLTTPKP